MSMVGNYLMADEEIVGKVRRGECSIEDLIYGKDDEGPADEAMDVDKAWQAIHFALTGRAQPGDEPDLLDAVVFGGEPVGEEDMGYGPVRCLEAETVKRLAEALRAIEPQTLGERFDWEAMRACGVYPVADGADAENFRAYVLDCYRELRVFFERAAQRGKCLLLYLD